ncbi:LETM1-like domain-containing protein [Paramicrosporidium saccamoebae]|uniref:Mitochondrial proton/calcium exchanger protein n=1 Tax=Paramicrosporidium saccamoebae TaxID=1246581 RepID=A0A2H9TLY4_9FUNG|nr:LETM1-like domain-containing protein [Paramicrosporidium saccamoebae]
MFLERLIPRVGYVRLTFRGAQFARAVPSSRQYSSDSPPVKPSIATRIKEGALHYWHGTKLLVFETRVSSKLLLKVLRGEKLIRREYRQLLRTTSDLIRLVPFIIMMIIPFLELALPLLLKFFPNMLPSTFEDRLQKEEKMKKQLKVKLETARFLQDMVDNMNGPETSKVKDLKSLFEKTRTSGSTLTTVEVVELCKQLSDEITLENLARPQLISLCKYMSLNAFGTDNFLRYQIRNAVERLKVDDKMIFAEGIESLTRDELRNACHARGIRTMGVPEEYMRRELKQWVELQVEHAVPAPLLILSRAFALSEDIKMEDALRAAITSLPDPVLSEAEVHAAESSKKSSASGKIKLIEEQERLITEELEQERQAIESKSPSDLSEAQLDSISEAVVTLATEDPMSQEKRELAELVQEQATNEAEAKKSLNSASKAIENQVGKLIRDIDHDISEFESEIGKRLQIISPSSDGTISVGQLRAIMTMVKNSPKDAEKISQAIKAFDSDGDGKIFINDILSVAEEAEDREGHGFIVDEKPSKSK